MNSLLSHIQPVWGPICWILLASSGILGLVALLSPKTFERIAIFGSRWIDSRKIIERLDKPIDVDRHLLAHSRKFGTAVLVAVAILGFRWSLR